MPNHAEYYGYIKHVLLMPQVMCLHLNLAQEHLVLGSEQHLCHINCRPA